MKDVGVRDLKIHASAIVQAVREKHEQYVVTHRGRPVGLLCPLERAPRPTGTGQAAAWDRLLALGDKISAGWRSKKTGAQLVSEMRRWHGWPTDARRQRVRRRL